MKRQLQVTKGPELEKLFIALRLWEEGRQEKFSFKNGDVTFENVAVTIYGIEYDLSYPGGFSWVIKMDIPKAVAVGENKRLYQRKPTFTIAVPYHEEKRISEVVEIKI